MFCYMNDAQGNSRAFYLAWYYNFQSNPPIPALFGLPNLAVTYYEMAGLGITFNIENLFDLWDLNMSRSIGGKNHRAVWG